jgi:HAD superfamily hydrolase (TIGR01509 family)
VVGLHDGCDPRWTRGQASVSVATDLLIFDCDGVLVDSEGLQTRVVYEVLRDHGVEYGDIDGALRFRGGKLADMISTLEEETSRKLPAGIVPEIRARTLAVFQKELRPVDGIAEVLRSLCLPYCVASNGPIEKMNVSLRSCGLLDLFAGRMFSAYDVGSWKPAPDLFVHAARTMGAKPERTTVIEDSALGVRAGAAAGMQVLGFAPPDRAAELSALGALRVFWPMRALLGLLGTCETR